MKVSCRGSEVALAGGCYPVSLNQAGSRARVGIAKSKLREGISDVLDSDLLGRTRAQGDLLMSNTCLRCWKGHLYCQRSGSVNYLCDFGGKSCIDKDSHDTD